MIRLLRGETLQLATTRTYWMLAAVALALIAAGTSAATATSPVPPAPARPAPPSLSPGWPRPSRC